MDKMYRIKGVQFRLFLILFHPVDPVEKSFFKLSQPRISRMGRPPFLIREIYGEKSSSA
jgi:hypothetical protein